MMSEYYTKKILSKFLNVFFSQLNRKPSLNLDLINALHTDHSRPMSRRESSFVLSGHHHSSNVSQVGDTDAFDSFQNILNVTDNQDALYAYYYLDENHKVKWQTEYNIKLIVTNIEIFAILDESNQNFRC